MGLFTGSGAHLGFRFGRGLALMSGHRDMILIGMAGSPRGGRCGSRATCGGAFRVNNHCVAWNNQGIWDGSRGCRSVHDGSVSAQDGVRFLFTGCCLVAESTSMKRYVPVGVATNLRKRSVLVTFLVQREPSSDHTASSNCGTAKKQKKLIRVSSRHTSRGPQGIRRRTATQTEIRKLCIDYQRVRVATGMG